MADRLVVTGANGGLGQALLKAARQAGHHVIALVRDRSGGDQLKARFADDAGIQIVEFDLSQPDQISAIAARLDAVDMLINNAGVAYPGAVEDSGATRINEVLAVNFLSPLALAKAVLPGMRRKGQGLIVNVTSLSAHVGLLGDGIYAGSKAALERAAESLRAEVAPFGVRVVNAVPGAVATPMQNKIRQACQQIDSGIYAALMQRIEIGAGGGDAPAVIAAEILALHAHADPPLCVAVGDQARAVLQKLAVLPEKKRAALITEFSDVAWWQAHVQASFRPSAQPE